MKILLLITAVVLFVGVFNLPIGYYTFLRIITTGAAILIIVSEFKKELTVWIILFGILAVLFNPFIPVYLHNKSVWKIIDIAAAVIFLVKAFYPEKKASA